MNLNNCLETINSFSLFQPAKPYKRPRIREKEVRIKINRSTRTCKAAGLHHTEHRKGPATQREREPE